MNSQARTGRQRSRPLLEAVIISLHAEAGRDLRLRHHAGPSANMISSSWCSSPALSGVQGEASLRKRRAISFRRSVRRRRDASDCFICNQDPVIAPNCMRPTTR